MQCYECGREITGEYWYRHYYDKIECYCPRCARAQMDERSCNGLICQLGQVFPEEKILSPRRGSNS